MSTNTVIEHVKGERAADVAAWEKILNRAELGKRALKASEQREVGRFRRQIEEFDVRIAELEEEEQRRDKAAGYIRGLERTGIRVISSPRTYDERSASENISFIRDIWQSGRGDVGAQERLGRHMREVAQDFAEYRDVGTGAFAGLVVPQYLTDLVAAVARAGRPTANICNIHDLPDEGMTVNISRITTGTGVGAQASENAAVTETNADDTLLTVNVNTIAGMQDVSRQAVERGTGIDAIIVQDLAKAYATELDRQILNTDGTGGTHLGIRSTTGIISVTYTDATPTAAEAWPKLWDLVQQIQTAVFMGVSHLVMHPRRWAWFASQVGTSFPFLQLATTAQGAGGTVLGTGTYEKGLAGVLATTAVILDANVPTTLGGGTEDVILGVTADELHLWEDPSAPLLIRSDEALSSNLTVRFVLYGYSGFAAGRYPGAHGTVSGTGCAAPTF